MLRPSITRRICSDQLLDKSWRSRALGAHGCSGYGCRYECAAMVSGSIVLAVYELCVPVSSCVALQKGAQGLPVPGSKEPYRHAVRHISGRTVRPVRYEGVALPRAVARVAVRLSMLVSSSIWSRCSVSTTNCTAQRLPAIRVERRIQFCTVMGNFLRANSLECELQPAHCAFHTSRLCPRMFHAD